MGNRCYPPPDSLEKSAIRVLDLVCIATILLHVVLERSPKQSNLHSSYGEILLPLLDKAQPTSWLCIPAYFCKRDSLIGPESSTRSLFPRRAPFQFDIATKRGDYFPR
jgi:hypothetical protein